uniref:Uncharacterized protein n=1 Tax=Pipistrellus kuhlii TaxID=59472 RepID=A0A7J7UG59_PIPKU|nr:hypothetical protein mPipKuh1_009061 [Pipistrellus kuhlii]
MLKPTGDLQALRPPGSLTLLTPTGDHPLSHRNSAYPLSSSSSQWRFSGKSGCGLGDMSATDRFLAQCFSVSEAQKVPSEASWPDPNQSYTADCPSAADASALSTTTTEATPLAKGVPPGLRGI